MNGPGGYIVVTTATIQCSGNYAGMTDRLRLEAYYGGGWHLVNKGSANINAAGRISITVSHPCTSNVSFEFRGYGQLYRNGIQKGVAIPSSSAVLQCQA